MMAFASELATACTRKHHEQRETAGSDDGKRTTNTAVLDVLVRLGKEGAAPWRISNLCRPFKQLSAQQRAFLLETMIEDRDVVTVRTKKGLKYVAARFSGATLDTLDATLDGGCLDQSSVDSITKIA